MNKEYDGRSQFKAVIDSINKWINEERTSIYIYTELTRNGLITLSYDRFQRYLAEHWNNEIRKIKNNFFAIYGDRIKFKDRLSDEDKFRIQILERVDFAVKKINKRHSSGVEKEHKRDLSDI